MMRDLMAPRVRATLTLLGATALSAALVAGCGEPAPVTDRDGVLRITMTDYALRPQNIKTRAGRIKLVARNEGRVAHDVVIEEDVEGDEAAEPQVFGRTDVARPGERVRERGVIVLRPGRYRIACSIANHDNLGQHGILEVTR